MKKIQALLGKWFCCTSLLCLSYAAIANEADLPNAEIGPGQAIGEVLIGLCVVTTTIVVLAWLVKRMGATKLVHQNGVKVLSSIPLSTREKIVLIEVEGKKLLIGVASGSISTLYQFDAERLHERKSSPDKSDEEEEKWEFSKYLKKIISDGPQK